jgi:malate dehydrogenase (oxaloacetate-decarboxylating)(NADP+)
VVFPEGEEFKVMKAAQILVDEGIALPILLGDESRIRRLAQEANLTLEGVSIVDPMQSDRRHEYAQYLWRRRQRKGLSHGEAQQRLQNGNYFGSVMVAVGHADALVSGVNLHYPETVRPALEVIGPSQQAELVAGVYMLVFEKRVIFCGDTTVNIDPTAEQLAQIGLGAARLVRTLGIVPRIAMLSFSNFGSVKHPAAKKVADAVRILRQKAPDLELDGEMQADTAFDPHILAERYPFSSLKSPANVLIFPNLSSGNIAYKLLTRLGGATAIGPILVGMQRPVHVLEQGADVEQIVNMAAVAVIDAQERSEPVEPTRPLDG